MTMERDLAGSTLNSLPEGLLDLLGIKSFGQYPNRLITQLQPTIDLGQMYLTAESNDYSFTISNPGGAAGQLGITATFPINLSNGAALVVPSGEVWSVNEFSLSWTTPAGAGDCAHFVPMMQSQGNNGIALASYSSPFGTAPTIRGGWSALARPVYCRPGSVLNIFTSGATIAAGNYTLNGCIRLARLTV